MKKAGQSRQDGGADKERTQRRTGLGEPREWQQDAGRRGKASVSPWDAQQLGASQQWMLMGETSSAGPRNPLLQQGAG